MSSESKEEQASTGSPRRIGIGIALGLGVGVAIGNSTGNLGAGIGIGVAIGIAVGVGQQPRGESGQDDRVTATSPEASRQ